MTICIAGIAENKKIVAFTDRMLTLGAPVKTAFEITANDKAKQLGDKVVAMFAGDVLRANAVLKIAKGNIKNADTGTEKIADIVQEAYREQWRKDIEDGLLSRFGLDRKNFINKQKELDSDVVKNINNTIGTYNLGVEIIIAGIDTNGEAHIFRVDNPGVKQTQDSIGYCCIGSGSQHATFSLIESEYNPHLSEAESIHKILQAKKRAQYDPGVGELTDIVLINDAYVKLAEEKVKNIDDIYTKSVTEISSKKDECARMLGEEVYKK